MIFLKRQILKMPEFAKRRDLLSVLLQDDRHYTPEEVRALLQHFAQKRPGA